MENERILNAGKEQKYSVYLNLPPGHGKKYHEYYRHKSVQVEISIYFQILQIGKARIEFVFSHFTALANMSQWDTGKEKCSCCFQVLFGIFYHRILQIIISSQFHNKNIYIRLQFQVSISWFIICIKSAVFPSFGSPQVDGWRDFVVNTSEKIRDILKYRQILHL